MRRLVASLKSRDDDAKIDVVDAAYWMKGCSSLGRLRYAVLLDVRNGKKGGDDFCLIDIKEATPAARRARRAPRCPPTMPHGWSRGRAASRRPWGSG